MISELSDKGIEIPSGFATTAESYWYFLEHNDLLEKIKQIMEKLTDPKDVAVLKKVGSEIRGLIEQGQMPQEVHDEIVAAYKDLCEQYGQENLSVAVRSSATAEDLPTASFAGQQETFLNVVGVNELIESCKKSMASLFTDRAIVYRIEQGFDHFNVALSVGVQKMVRSDLASAGVIFTLDTETGFKDIVMINSAYGLGEVVVKGEVIPDEFLVFKPTLKEGFDSLVKKQLGDKTVKTVYANSFTKTINTDQKEKDSFSLTDEEILQLARYAVIIEDHYADLHGRWSPMDIEWAKDGIDGKLYILQARPETIYAPKKDTDFLKLYALKDKGDKNLSAKILIKGQSIGNKIATGNVKVIDSAKDIGQVQAGDILVTKMTDPDWVPAMKKAAGIVTDRGGRTCHAAIVSRELGVPAIVGAQGATNTLKTGQAVTIDCSRGKTGYVYDGVFDFEMIDIPVGELSTADVPCDVMVNIADPDRAFSVSFLPNDGVGLARVEFIINNFIQIHPMALVHPEKVTDKEVAKKIAFITRAYENKKEFFVDNLAYGIATIACAFYPKPVIVRLSDFKSNEYRNLIGGTYFEPVEENPMLGWRGASRYYNKHYKAAFALECKAIKKARDEIGLKNIRVMVPFVRTVGEAEKVLQELANHGLKSGKDNLDMVMMCEIPSNALLIDEFSKLFDGFSIGSNDLTQLTLGVDRDSDILAPLFDERDAAVKKIMAMAIEGALKNKRYIGICGQAPSDLPEIAKFLIERGISSISLSPDAIAQFLMLFCKK
ncbi:phosphoenolpyruvate synthase [Candidatus Dependentiae bacterium]